MNTKTLTLELTMGQMEELLRCVPGRLGWLEKCNNNPTHAQAAFVLRAGAAKLEKTLKMEWDRRAIT